MEFPSPSCLVNLLPTSPFFFLPLISQHLYDTNGGEPYGFTGEWYEGQIELLHLRARWYLPETGTFLSVDPVESEPPYAYVRGNVVNLTDPSGFAPHCGPEKPCRVIVGANRLRSSLPWLRPIIYHSYILVADPNRQQRPELGLSDPPPKFDKRGIPGHIEQNEDVTVYFFWAGPERRTNIFRPGKLTTSYGYHRREDSLDYVAEPHGTFNEVYETLDRNRDCSEILECLKREYDFVKSLERPYQAFGVNSNTTASFALGRCGLRNSHPPQGVLAPGWGLAMPDRNINPPTPDPQGTPTPNGPDTSTPGNQGTPTPGGQGTPTPRTN